MRYLHGRYYRYSFWHGRAAMHTWRKVADIHKGIIADKTAIIYTGNAQAFSAGSSPWLRVYKYRNYVLIAGLLEYWLYNVWYWAIIQLFILKMKHAFICSISLWRYFLYWIFTCHASAGASISLSSPLIMKNNLDIGIREKRRRKWRDDYLRFIYFILIGYCHECAILCRADLLPFAYSITSRLF